MNIIFDLEHLLHYHSIYLWLFNIKKSLQKLLTSYLCFFFFLLTPCHSGFHHHHQHLTPFKIHSDLHVLRSYGKFSNFVLFNFLSIFGRIDGSFFLKTLSACGVQQTTFSWFSYLLSDCCFSALSAGSPSFLFCTMFHSSYINIGMPGCFTVGLVKLRTTFPRILFPLPSDWNCSKEKLEWDLRNGTKARVITFWRI